MRFIQHNMASCTITLSSTTWSNLSPHYFPSLPSSIDSPTNIRDYLSTRPPSTTGVQTILNVNANNRPTPPSFTLFSSYQVPLIIPSWPSQIHQFSDLSATLAAIDICGLASTQQQNNKELELVDEEQTCNLAHYGTMPILSRNIYPGLWMLRQRNLMHRKQRITVLGMHKDSSVTLSHFFVSIHVLLRVIL